MLSLTWVIGLLCGFVAAIALSGRRQSRSALLPPGPPRIPLLGNVRDMPRSHEWLTYNEWAKHFGDIFYLKVFGKSLIVLNSPEAAKELLEMKSAISSDRPGFCMISDLMGWDWAVQFIGVGPRFRRYRKNLHQLLRPQSLRAYWPAIRKGTKDLLRGFLQDPERFQEHLKHHSGGLMMTILYGEEAGPVRDQYVAKADDAIDGLVEAGNIGKFLVNFIPSLKFIPEWAGANFKKKARIWRQMNYDMIQIPYDKVERDFNAGLASPSVVQELLTSKSHLAASDLDEELIMGIAGVMYVGGADTTLSALNTFILAMVLYPEAQKVAQAELDRVVGHSRLPDFIDRPSLPYVDCLLSEVLRWNPAVPLGVPHRLTEDCELRGYYVPAGTTILANQWAILHDEKIYPNPFEFTPERFLSDSKIEPQKDPRTASFGFASAKLHLAL